MARTEEQKVITRGGRERIVMGKRLAKRTYTDAYVSSSFISKVDYHYRRGLGNGLLIIYMISGKVYPYQDVPFDVFEGFYYAHSKGTYYNKYIKGQYK